MIDVLTGLIEPATASALISGLYVLYKILRQDRIDSEVKAQQKKQIPAEVLRDQNVRTA